MTTRDDNNEILRSKGDIIHENKFKLVETYNFKVINSVVKVLKENKLYYKDKENGIEYLFTQSDKKEGVASYYKPIVMTPTAKTKYRPIIKEDVNYVDNSIYINNSTIFINDKTLDLKIISDRLEDKFNSIITDEIQPKTKKYKVKMDHLLDVQGFVTRDVNHIFPGVIELLELVKDCSSATINLSDKLMKKADTTGVHNCGTMEYPVLLDPKHNEAYLVMCDRRVLINYCPYCATKLRRSTQLQNCGNTHNA